MTTTRHTSAGRRGARLLHVGVLTLLVGSHVVGLASPSSAATPTCFGKPASIEASGFGVVRGTRFNDVIVTTGPVDVYGLGGNDLICGSGHVFAGPGDDKVFFAGSANIALDLWGGPGDDTLRLRTAAWGDMVGGRGHDRIFGFLGRQYIDAGPGRDRVEAGPGNDRILGGTGDDYLDAGRGRDRADGGPGLNTCLRAERTFNC